MCQLCLVGRRAGGQTGREESSFSSEQRIRNRSRTMASSTRSPDPVTLTPDTCRAHPRRQHLSHPGRWSAALVPALAALSLLLAACSQSAPATSAAPPTAGRHPSATAGKGPGTCGGGGSVMNLPRGEARERVTSPKHPFGRRAPPGVSPDPRGARTPQGPTSPPHPPTAAQPAAESAAGLYTTLGGWLPGAS